jgi:L-fucose isomerase
LSHRNRLIGDIPKRIRPTIDNRSAAREVWGQLHGHGTWCRRIDQQNLRHYNGMPVACVIADSTIGGVAEAAACADKFARENVSITLTVTPCWCYGSETMDMDPLTEGSLGLQRHRGPGAVYLAAVAAGHNQKGLPIFNIYGRDVQDGGDTEIPADVQEKLLRFARAGLTVANMRGKSYLAMGGVSMGIAGSIVNQEFFEEFLGMRVETIDMTEFVRRMNEVSTTKKSLKLL